MKSVLLSSTSGADVKQLTVCLGLAASANAVQELLQNNPDLHHRILQVTLQLLVLQYLHLQSQTRCRNWTCMGCDPGKNVCCPKRTLKENDILSVKIQKSSRPLEIMWSGQIN